MPISACVITRDEAERIDECLGSVAWCDELVVVDSHSTDATRERAAARGARVIERDWPGHAAQKEFAVRAAHHDWVLCIDADERVSPAAAGRDPDAARRAASATAAGWSVPRLSNYLGAWIRHGTWYPDRSCGSSIAAADTSGQPGVRSRTTASSSTARARRCATTCSICPTAPSTSTCAPSTPTRRSWPRACTSSGRRARVSDLVVHPWARFVKFYVLKGGFLDGWRGLLLAYLAAHYVRLKYAKLLALQRAPVG